MICSFAIIFTVKMVRLESVDFGVVIATIYEDVVLETDEEAN